jgi:hypothetical protein
MLLPVWLALDPLACSVTLGRAFGIEGWVDRSLVAHGAPLLTAVAGHGCFKLWT